MKLPRPTLPAWLKVPAAAEAEDVAQQERAQQQEESQAALSAVSSFAAPQALSLSAPGPVRRPTQGLLPPRPTRGNGVSLAAAPYPRALQLVDLIRDAIAQGSARQRQAKVDALLERLERALTQCMADGQHKEHGPDASARIKLFAAAVRTHRTRMARGLDLDTSHQLLRQDLGGALMRRAAYGRLDG